jgi:tetraprenyl-beta-curcumene synthase
VLGDHRAMIATLKTVATLSDYGVSIVPRARREIRRWAAAAAAIPDPVLRSHATHAVLVDGRNAEAVAALAATAPRRQRRTTVELLVAYQLLVDYVDTLGERVCADELRRGLRLGMALVSAARPPTSPIDLDPLGDDGGYLVALVTTCRGRFRRLPAAEAVAEEVEAAALRCGQALAYTHAATRSGTLGELRGWAAENATADYSWWEVAAGGNSSIAILALLAAAADPLTNGRDAAAVASSYWPHVCVMSTMLDSLADYEQDRMSGEFSFVSHYPDVHAARDGLTRATQRSLAATKPLRRPHRHTMIVRGVAGYYAASAASGSLAAEVAPSVIAQLGRAAKPIVLALRARHRRSRDAGPVRSSTTVFLTRSRGSVRGPGGSGSSTTNCDGTGDFE